MSKKKVVISFGANLGNCIANINNAVNYLKSKNIIQNFVISKIEKTRAILPENSPVEWDIDYYNAVGIGMTIYAPNELMKELKEIEKTLGREEKTRWAPRIIDIDILFYENLVDDDGILHIPHKEFLNRPFFIKLLTEIDPDFLYPVPGKFFNNRISDILENLESKND